MNVVGPIVSLRRAGNKEKDFYFRFHKYWLLCTGYLYV